MLPPRQSIGQIAVEWTEPTRAAAVWRSIKVVAHIVRRALQNAIQGPKRIRPSRELIHAMVMAEHRSKLWVDGREDEFILRCGKVQNLRVAVRHFDGIEVQAGERLSFWSQLGRPSAARGYVVGREIVNGCVVPTLGGGLCQLSNALADVANIAGIALIEHHRHSALIEQQVPSSADATVAWNYIDLRMQANFSFRIEAHLTHDELVVRLRAANQPRGVHFQREPIALVDATKIVARGCLTCEQTTCFRYRPPTRAPAARTAYLLNEWSPELSKSLEDRREDADWVVPWVRLRRRHLAWNPPRTSNITVARWPSYKRMARSWLHRITGRAHQVGRAQTAFDLAHHAARALRPEHCDLVVSQDLLVPLWRRGALAGRAYDVWVPELPASEIQTRLDQASKKLPQAASLRDFRVPPDWAADEWAALRAARRRFTAHAQVAHVLRGVGLAVDVVPWCESRPSPVVRQPTGSRLPTMVFAASALARKGSHEVATVATKLGLRVLILGSAPTDTKLWAGVDWCVSSYTGDWLDQSDLVVLPAYVEHRPRALLQALAAGVPVIASSACGLGPRPGLSIVEAGNAQALESTVKGLLKSR